MNNREKRDSKKFMFYKSLPTYDEIFTFLNLYMSALKCKSGVIWKKEVQLYHSDLAYNISVLEEKLLSMKYTPQSFIEFDITERGKRRHIKAPRYEDRIVQKCLCDNFLVPLLSRNLIYDNSATIKGKGTDFAINRLKCHLEKYNRQHGNGGYIMIFDFIHYFDSIDHDILYDHIDPMILDINTRNLVHRFIDDFGNIGLGLGSQVSQICAVFFANTLDHLFKDRCGVKYYGRYMDDGYIITDNLSNLNKYKQLLIDSCKLLKLDINESKINVYKLDRPFVFLKHRFILKDDEVIIKSSKITFIKMARKLKKYKFNTRMTYNDIVLSYKSWRGMTLKYKNYLSIKKTDDLYNQLYITPFITGEYIL